GLRHLAGLALGVLCFTALALNFRQARALDGLGLGLRLAGLFVLGALPVQRRAAQKLVGLLEARDRAPGQVHDAGLHRLHWAGEGQALFAERALSRRDGAQLLGRQRIDFRAVDGVGQRALVGVFGRLGGGRRGLVGVGAGRDYGGIHRVTLLA